MKSFFGKTIVKKTISVILVLAVAAGVAFAAPLKIQTGLGDAKVYDSQYKAVKNPVEVSDNFVLRTSTTPVILNTDTISVEVEPNSLLQFISLDKEVVFYLLDGKAAFTSNVAFEVRTPVTKYKSQAGTAIYVITEEAEETAYVNAGQAEATNLITGEVTQIAKGTTIDSTKKTAQTSSTTREDYWKASSAPAAQAEQKPAETKQEQEPVVEPVVEPAAEPEKAAEVQPAEEAVTETVVTNLGALEHTFSYRGITATLRAYIGYAELEYPEYVTTEEIDAAARAAVLTFPETVTQDIRYEVAKPGLALIYYPETYGPTEFEMAIYLLDQELPGYIDALLAPAAAPEQQKAEEQPQQQSEQAQAATQPAEAPVQPTVRETIESKVEKPAQTTEPAPAEEPVEEKKGFRFGASVGFIYGHGDRGDYFADPVFLHERFGVFMKNYMAIIDPIFSFGNFSFGLHLVADFRSGSFVNPIDNLRFDSVTGAVNSVMQFVSVINYTKGNFSFNVDRTSNLEFTSPIFTKHDRNYDHDSKLLATMKYCVLHAGLHELREEIHVLLAVVQNILEHVLEEVLGDLHIPFQGAEAHLGLDHPELGQVSLGVGVLGTEGRSECVDVLQGGGISLAFQLSAYGQAGTLAEEVLGVVDLSVFGPGDVVQIQGRDLEHLARSLGIACGDKIPHTSTRLAQEVL